MTTPIPGGIFYGWWIVAACFVISTVSNSLVLYGTSIYLRAITATFGWSTALVSGAATLALVVNALVMVPVGIAISRLGPRPVMTAGTIALAAGVTGIGQSNQLWQVYLAFLALGLGLACLSTPAIATTLAPWFDRQQGRAVSLAVLGASVSGIIGAPAMLFGIRQIGFPATTLAAACVALGLLPLSLCVLQHRPSDLGLLVDGEPPRDRIEAHEAPRPIRGQALRTAALLSVVVGFGLGMMAQTGFLTHLVSLLAPTLGETGTSATIPAISIAALTGRLLLARYADHVPLRRTASAVLVVAAAVLSLLALWPIPAVLVGGSIAFGLTIGNVTTLSAIIIRREFGAASFGAIYGAASTGIALTMACGPGLYGVLHDAFGGYGPVLLVAAALDLLAAVIVYSGCSTVD